MHYHCHFEYVRLGINVKTSLIKTYLMEGAAYSGLLREKWFYIIAAFQTTHCNARSLHKPS